MTTVSDLATGDTITEAWTDSVTIALNRVGCAVTRVATQSIPSGTGTFTAISWDTESYDSNGFIAPTSTTMTVPSGYDGIYTICGNITWASSPGTNAIVEVLYNGSTTVRYPVGAATQLPGGFSATLSMGATDTIQVRVSQGSGGAINVTAFCQMWRVAI